MSRPPRAAQGCVFSVEVNLDKKSLKPGELAASPTKFRDDLEKQHHGVERAPRRGRHLSLAPLRGLQTLGTCSALRAWFFLRKGAGTLTRTLLPCTWEVTAEGKGPHELQGLSTGEIPILKVLIAEDTYFFFFLAQTLNILLLPFFT